MIHADGSQSGINKCGDRWTYDAQTKIYKNENGEIRQGEGAFVSGSNRPCLVPHNHFQKDRLAPTLANHSAQRLRERIRQETVTCCSVVWMEAFVSPAQIHAPEQRGTTPSSLMVR